jgi:hypothetical protein
VTFDGKNVFTDTCYSSKGIAEGYCGNGSYWGVTYRNCADFGTGFKCSNGVCVEGIGTLTR